MRCNHWRVIAAFSLAVGHMNSVVRVMLFHFGDLILANKQGKMVMFTHILTRPFPLRLRFVVNQAQFAQPTTRSILIAHSLLAQKKRGTVVETAPLKEQC